MLFRVAKAREHTLQEQYSDARDIPMVGAN
jgi:hypothetical protein